MLTFDMLARRHEALMANKKTAVVAIDDNFVIPAQKESIRRTAGITANDVLRTAVHLLAALPQKNEDFCLAISPKVCYHIYNIYQTMHFCALFAAACAFACGISPRLFYKNRQGVFPCV